nr:zf-BED domain-containing protein [Tanacetum cinerariifolium]
MDDDLFTYEDEIPELPYLPSVEKQMDDGNPGVYKRKVCYDESEEIYVKSVIFVNKRLVRLIYVTIEQWLELKYGDQSTISNEVKENVITTWLIRSYKKQFKEYMKLKKQ